MSLFCRDFIKSCGKALEINHQLIKEDQQMYHDDMKDKYSQMRAELAKFIDDEVIWTEPIIVLYIPKVSHNALYPG